jgi:tryptophan synthase alpha chain
MSRIGERFAALKTEGRKALIPYLTAGDPEPGFTVQLMHTLVSAGADILEVGVPFSDPMAEGPVIQRAMERALVNHVSLSDVIDMVAEFRKQDASTPVLLMGYLNPVEVMGYAEFVNKATDAGVDGVLLVDLPPEEADELLSKTNEAGLDVIFLVSPTTTDTRIKSIAAKSGGFVYYVSLKGVTGAGHLDANEVKERVMRIRQSTDLPVGVGFGIKDGDSAQKISAVADAVVVGSALVRLVEENMSSISKVQQALSRLVSEMRSAMDAHMPASAAKMQNQ